MRDGLAGDLGRKKDDDERRSYIVRAEDRLPNSNDIDLQLFAELAPRRVEIGLPFFALAPRELPETAVALVQWALTDEVPIASPDDRGHDPRQVRTRRGVSPVHGAR